MIIIEGPDCAGKTTLAQTLWSHPRLQERGMEVQHLSRLPTGHDREHHYIARMNVNGIFDRFHYSELAYAKARGDAEILLTPAKFKSVERALNSTFAAFKILLTISTRDILERRWTKSEMYSQDIVWAANEEFKSMRLLFDYHFDATNDRPFVDASYAEWLINAYLERRGDL